MRRRCRRYQMQWMEAHDQRRPVPPELQRHVMHCADCRSWAAYLRAERAVVRMTASLPVPERQPLRTHRATARSHRHLLLQWAGVLTVVVLLVGIGWVLSRFSGNGRPDSAYVDREVTATVPAVFDIDTIFAPPEEAWSYLKVSGVWWTQEDLHMLSVLETEESIPENPSP